MNNFKIEGIVAYPVTPFFENSSQINDEVLKQVIDLQISSGANAIAPLGSAGEGAYLDDMQWNHLVDKTLEYVAGRVPIIIGIAELTTRAAVRKAQYAQAAGAHAIMVSPFSYQKLTEPEIFQHYQTISNSSALPIMAYNNPSVCGVDMSSQFLVEMVTQIEHVSMIKESSGDIHRMHDIEYLSNGTIPFYNGCNYIVLDALKAGAQGWCTAALGLIDDLPKRLFNSYRQGLFEQAETLFKQQLPFLKFIVKNGLAVTVKAAYELRNISVGYAQPPLLPLTEDMQKQLKDLLSMTLLTNT